LAFRKRAHTLVEQRFQIETADHFIPKFSAATKQAEAELKCPVQRLGRPWRDCIREVEQRRPPLNRTQASAIQQNRTAVGRQRSAKAFEQCSFARAIRAYEAQNLTLLYAK